jgi:peroxiredoxin
VTHDTASEKGSLREDQARLMFGEGFSFSGYERDALFLGDGSKFLDISGVSGIDSLSDGRAAVMADFDNDGDLDVFLTTLQGEAHLLFRNNVGQDAHFLRVMLEGASGTARDAFGAVVRIRLGDRTLTKIKAGGMGFMSQHDPRLLFGLASEPRVGDIEVTWPGGRVERFPGPFTAGTAVRLRQGEGSAAVVETRRTRLADPMSRTEVLASRLKVAVGQPMPDLAVRATDGATTTLSALRRPGRAMLVNIWATWCAPCRVEMHELQALLPQFTAAGIDLIGVSVDTDPKADLAAFARKTGATYPLFAGGVPAIEALYATDDLFVPMSVVVDESGVVSDLLPGWSETTRQRFATLAGTR